MAYEGNVALINGLIPANGQNFPLIHMDHVYLNDTTRLSDFVFQTLGAIDDLNYIPIAIDSFTIKTPSGGVVEKGTTVSSITYGYSLNKEPNVVLFDGTQLQNPPKSTSGITVSGLSLTANKTFTLRAQDKGSSSKPITVVTKNATLYFYDKIHWGVSSVPSAYNDAFLLTTLTNHELASGRTKTFTVNAGSGKYIFFALPTSMGTPNFNVGGFDGGFKKVAEFSHTNSTGSSSAKTNYAVWKSDNANLGSTTVKVS